MSSTVTSRRSTGPAPQTPKRDWGAEVSRTVKRRPSAIICYGVPGVGKTSFAAQYPGVAFMVDDKERGIDSLKESGLVDEAIPVYPGISKWGEALDLLDHLRTSEHDHKALAIDAMGGFERLCHEEVCRRDFNGNWGKDGFTSFQAGYDVSLAEWKLFLNAVDRLRDERAMSIMILGHAKVAPFKNPSGPDFDRYVVDVHHKTWSITHKWADMVLFSNYEVAFAASDQNKQKAKAKGGSVRVMFTEHEAAFDAKNRHNLPPEIDMGKTAAEAFANFKAAILEGRNQVAKAGE